MKEIIRKTAFVDMDGPLLVPLFQRTTNLDYEKKLLTAIADGDWIEFCETEENPYSYCNPIWGVIQFLKRLRQYKGSDLKILSVAMSPGERAAKRKWLDFYRLDGLFSDIVFFDNDAEKIEYLANYADAPDVDPSKCMLIEDNYPNVIAATKIGMRAIHVSHVLCGAADALVGIPTAYPIGQFNVNEALLGVSRMFSVSTLHMTPRTMDALKAKKVEDWMDVDRVGKKSYLVYLNKNAKFDDHFPHYDLQRAYELALTYGCDTMLISKYGNQHKTLTRYY